MGGETKQLTLSNFSTATLKVSLRTYSLDAPAECVDKLFGRCVEKKGSFDTTICRSGGWSAFQSVLQMVVCMNVCVNGKNMASVVKRFEESGDLQGTPYCKSIYHLLQPCHT